MSPCSSRAALKELLAERLSPDQERSLLAHVDGCPACQQILEELTASCALAPSVSGPEAAAGLPGKPSSEEEAFWHGLKAALPAWLPTKSPELPGNLAGKATEMAPRLGRYELREEIARGGMGVVLRGHDPDLGRDLAVKVLLPDHQHDPAVVSRFTEEAQIGGQLQHPGIVPVYEVGRSADQRPYFTMKLVKGRTLAALLRERARPADDLPRFIGIFEQVCQTLAYAHSKGVLHRDLKPANVMVGAFGEVQVMDWGLAKVLRPTAGTPASVTLDPVRSGILTVRSHNAAAESQAGAALGTPAYMAPEQARGEVDRLDERADVFGLGAMLCEILTGRPPFTGRSAREVLARATSAEVADAYNRLEACGADADLVRLARECLAVDRERRPRDAGVVAAAVTAYQHSVAERLRRAELERAAAQVQAREERKRRRLTAALAAAALALVLMAAGGVLWLQWLRAERRAEAMQHEQALRQDVEAALTQAASFRQGFHFRQGHALLDGARQRLSVQGPDDLRERVHQALADLRLAERFDAARLQAAIIVKGKMDAPGGEHQYAAAFAEANLGHEGEDTNAVAARVRDSALRAEIVAALDDWAGITNNQARREWLLSVACEADPDSKRVRLRQPQVWRDRGALTNLAQEATETLVQGEEAAVSSHLATALGRSLRQSGGDAVPLLAAAQARFPQDFWLNFELAWALYKAQRRDEAEGFYRAALALRPEASVVHVNLGLALTDLGRLDDAIVHYQAAVRLDPEFVMAHSDLGAALIDKGRLDEALKHCKQAVRLDPTFSMAQNNLGLALANKGQSDQASARYQQALDLDPANPAAHVNLGNLLYARGRLDEAIDHYQQALRIDPTIARAHNNLGVVLKDKGRLDEAIGHGQRALELDPKSADAHLNLALALKAKGLLDAAIDHHQQALRINPKDAPVHVSLGITLHSLGRLDEAIDQYQQALDLNPKYALAHVAFALALQDQRRLDEAIDHCRQALNLDPKNAWAHKALGEALLAQGCFRKAEAATGRGLDLLPQGDPSRETVTEQLQRCRQLPTLESRLPAVLQGQDKPADAAEYLRFAELCRIKRQHAAAARLYAGAFTANAQLAEDLKTGHRYNAACSAALAAAGQGVDATTVNNTERTRLRRQALDWLRADLAASAKTPDRALVQRTLRYWQQDPDLAGIRDQEALAKLPSAERDTWTEFWFEVANRLPESSRKSKPL
jgi:serine/threonine-protein kinase